MSVVLVTGATGGIGTAVVRAYAARGAQLVLLARSRGDLEDLAAEVTASGAPEPLVTVADVADADAVDAAFATARQRFEELDVVVHSAAVVAYGRLTEVPRDVWDRAITIGVLGTSNVARAALQVFEAQPGGGHLVVVGSVLGRVTTPLMGAYVMAKFAVRGLVRVLQQEARSTPGVHVAVVEPGAVATPIYVLAGNYAGWIGRPPPPVAAPEVVARAVLSTVDGGRRAASVGLANPLMKLGFAVTPWLYDRLVTPLMRLGGLSRQPVDPHPGNVWEASESVRSARRIFDPDGPHGIPKVTTGTGLKARSAAGDRSGRRLSDAAPGTNPEGDLMISTESVQSLIGSTAYGPDGNKLGTIGQIYLDNNSGQPEWATIKTGLFGTKESFVPLREAELSGDGVRLPYDKDRIKGAPNIDADREVSPEEETALYEYYGFAVGGLGTGTDTSGTGMTTGTRETTEATGYDTSGPTTDDAMTRSEERARVGTERHEAGRARLRKYVVTEQQKVDVPVTHEEVHVEREPITDANRDRAMGGPELSDEEHEVVLNEERPVVQKETVPVERVRLSKDQVTDEENVNVDVRQERIDTDVDSGIDRR